MENLMALLIDALGEYEAQKAQIVARDDSAEIEQAVEGYRERLIRSYEEKKAAQIAENEISIRAVKNLIEKAKNQAETAEIEAAGQAIQEERENG